MSTDAVAILGFVALFALMLLRVPVGMAMGLVGVSGFGYLVGGTPALKLVGQTSMRTVTDYTFGVIPMFLLMGAFVSNSGMSRDLFRAANGFVGHLRGGLGIRHRRRLRRLCRDLRLVGGDRRDVFRRRLSGNAALRLSAEFRHRRDRGRRHARRHAAALHRARGLRHHHRAGHRQAVHRRHHSRPARDDHVSDDDLRHRPSAAGLPAGRPAQRPGAQRFAGLKDIWAPMLLFVFVIGGLYGLPFLPRFTPTEAGGVGATGAFLIGVFTGRLNKDKILAALLQATRTAAAVFTVLIGALIFGYFLTITQTPQKVTEFLTGLGLGSYGVLALIMLMYLVLGCLMDAMAMIILTVPIIFPVVTHLGFDPIWFGVIIVMTVELGLIHPPVGMNVFVIKSVVKDVSFTTIFKGVMPFIVTDLIRLVILIAFPIIALWLPSHM